MKIIEKPDLPKEVFNQETAPRLLAQAVRVHLANLRQGTQSALTRAEVARTRKKLYKQKGTGGARHGDRKAPIFVGGGIAFAPKPRDYALRMSDKMRRQAINGALTLKVKEKKLSIVSGAEKLSGKTAEVAKFLDGLDGKEGREGQKVLLITDQVRENVWRAGRNIAGVTIMPVSQVNAYEIMRADLVVIMEEALQKVTPVTQVTQVTKVTRVTKVTSAPKVTENVRKKVVKAAKRLTKKTM